MRKLTARKKAELELIAALTEEATLAAEAKLSKLVERRVSHSMPWYVVDDFREMRPEVELKYRHLRQLEPSWRSRLISVCFEVLP